VRDLDDRPPAVDVDVSWAGAAGFPPERQWTEASVQGVCGLMAVHGWDHGRPRRLGLEVASVAAGLLAASGVLAARIGALRDRPVTRVETSVLGAGLWLVAHHLAAATSEGDPLPSPPGPEPGPPFRSAEGRWFEIEVFDPDAWMSFWERLGAGDADLGRGWTAFRARYYRGRCSLPAGLHEAAARHPLAEIAAVAAGCGVSLCPVRSYLEVLREPGPDRDRPLLGPVSSTARPPRGPGGAGAVDPGLGGLPLGGLRVVEATSRMQGPLAGLLLRMLGAEVVRVEPPGGDPGRLVPPVAGHTGSFFLCFNRGKATVEVDLARPSGRGELRDLLAGSDVFLHNWRPGKAAEWELDRAAVAAALPRLVYAEATGWDPAAENARLIGTDFLVQAYAGFGDGLNPTGQPPFTSRALLTDCLGALVTCEGLLTALYVREVTGHAPSVRSSLLQGALAASAHVLAALARGHEDNGRCGGRPVWGPLDHPLGDPTRPLVVSADDDARFARLCAVSGVDPTAGSRATAEQAVADVLGAGDPEDWERRLTDEGVPCATVATDLAAVTADPRMAALFEPLSETVLAPASPWRLDP
jgi:crotonobetainyl-CoA:carnitine CoA-transferase CaiB-like acyl-CoA transferase